MGGGLCNGLRNGWLGAMRLLSACSRLDEVELSRDADLVAIRETVDFVVTACGWR